MNIFVKLLTGLFKGSIEKAAEQKAEEWLDELHDKSPDIHAAVLHILNDAAGRLRPLVASTETEFDDIAIDEVEKIIADSANKYGIALGSPVKSLNDELSPTDPDEHHGGDTPTP